MKKIGLLFCFLTIELIIFAQNPLFIPPVQTGNNFNLTLQKGSKTFFQGFKTPTLGFNGDFLGPTLVFKKGDSVHIDVLNRLDSETTVHWHGLQVPSKWDGGPGHATHIHVGQTWKPRFKILNRAATYWYHPHAHGTTQNHVVSGLAGMIIIQDQEEAALSLPRTYGVDDIPLIIQDKTFDSTSRAIVITGLSHQMMVNGVLNPQASVPAQMVRFRALNGSAARHYYLGLSDSSEFYQIATDAGLLEKPLKVKRLQLAPGERVEIVVNFNNRRAGDTLSLMSYAPEMAEGVPGQGAVAAPGLIGENSPLNGAVFPIMKIKIINATANAITTVPPAQLTVHAEKPKESDVSVTRRLTIGSPNNGAGGPFYFNGQFFDENIINQVVKLDATEIWEIRNQTLIGHPFHIHDISFFILKRGNGQPLASEQGPKDVVFVNRGETVRFIAKFDKYADHRIPFMYHCHMLAHEDDGLMGQFLVVDETYVSIQNVQNPHKLSLFPNPTTGVFELKAELKQHSTVTVEVISTTGQVVLKSKEMAHGAFQKNIDLSPYPDGVWFVRLIADGAQSTHKVVLLRN